MCFVLGDARVVRRLAEVVAETAASAIEKAGSPEEALDGGGGDDDGDAVVVVVALDVTPRTLDDATRQYVRATLVLTLDASYPESSPSINLTDARGLDDRRQGVVLDALQTARVECASAGDPVLALLCETAFETMTTLNHPDGDCVFCLDAVARAAGEEEDEEGGGGGDGGGGGGGGDENVVKMTRCYHCFHAACFGGTEDEYSRAEGRFDRHFVC